jgi:hypothetical protein
MAIRQPFGTVLSRARARGLFGALALVIAIGTQFAPFSRGSDASPPAETPPLEGSAEQLSRATPEELCSRVAPSVATILVKDETGEVVATTFTRASPIAKSGNLEKPRDELTTARALGWPAAACDAELAACGQRRAGPAHGVHARLLDVSSDPADVDKSSITVYVTKTGKKYHRATCRHLSRSKIPLPLDEAARLYGPCSHCRPPTP